MSAAEDDTELRDLLTQNLEHSGVLNKLKAEMRAAVFLAMEEQDKVDNKSPLVNENLKNCLNTRDGRLVASLIIDFLQVYHLDFTLAVFQPEINSLNGLDSRDLVCRDLGLSDSEKESPLLLEVIRRSRHKDRAATLLEDLSPKQMANAKKKFELFDKEHRGSVMKEDLVDVFTVLLPTLNTNMLERFVADELRAVDQTSSQTVDFQVFLGLYKRLFAQCRSVVADSSGEEAQVSKPCAALNRVLDLDLEVEDDLDDGDSFFDDPLPKPQKIYGWKGETSRTREDPVGSTGGRTGTASDLSHNRNDDDVGYKADFNSHGSDLSKSHGSDLSKSHGSDLSKSHGSDLSKSHGSDLSKSHGSDLSKSELSGSEEIKDVSIEGPENSTKFDETTQDVSVSQLSQSHGADYMEDVA